MSKDVRGREQSDIAARMLGGREFVVGRLRVDDLHADLRRVDGPADGPNFVLVHGIGVSARYFQPLAIELARVGTVWLTDLPGYGAVPKPRRTVTIDDHATVLASVIEQAAITDPVLVGHSMGCQVVAALAARSPDVSDRLVLLGPTINPAERSFWWASFRLFQDILREPFRANLVVGTDYFFRCGPAYYIRQLPQLLGDHIEERLVQIEVPTLVIAGERDPVARRGWVNEAARLLPHGTVAFVRGPHVIMFTDPAGVARLIVDHLA